MHISKLPSGYKNLLPFLFEVIYDAFEEPHMGRVYNINPDLQIITMA
jgi:hypothetical protein